MFEDIKMAHTRKSAELKIWLDSISEDKEKIYSEGLVSKGLYFVYEYGIIEWTVKTVVERTIDELNSAHVLVGDCITDLYPLVFNGEYDAIYGAGRDTKWDKRYNISKKMKENSIIYIPSNLMPTDGKNIQHKQLKSIAQAFGMKDNVLPKDEIGGYLRDVVQNRNHIAHGDETPHEVGRRYSKFDLQNRHRHMDDIREYMIGIYEKYIFKKSYLK